MSEGVKLVPVIRLLGREVLALLLSHQNSSGVSMGHSKSDITMK